MKLNEILRPKSKEDIEKDLLKLIDTNPELFCKQLDRIRLYDWEGSYYKYFINKHLPLLIEKFDITVERNMIDITNEDSIYREYLPEPFRIYFKLK